MPCMCWYHPTDKQEKELKDSCQKVVDILRDLYKEGDPVFMGHKTGYQYAANLIRHLYTGHCDENSGNSS